MMLVPQFACSFRRVVLASVPLASFTYAGGVDLGALVKDIPVAKVIESLLMRTDCGSIFHTAKPIKNSTNRHTKQHYIMRTYVRMECVCSW